MRSGVLAGLTAAALMPAGIAHADPLAPPVLASARADGTPGNGASGTYGLSLSGNGEVVAFSSVASDLDAGDVDAVPDVYVKDLASGRLTLASRSTSGVKGGALSVRPSLDAAGDRVAFVSSATDLDPADTDGNADVFVEEPATGLLRLVSVDADGHKGSADSTGAVLSGDGSTVAFVSRAADLSPDDRDTSPDLYVKDLETGRLQLVSRTSSGGKAQPGPYGIGRVSLSADGSRVAFDTDAALVPEDTDGAVDVYVVDVGTGTVALASLGSDGADSATGSYRPSLSADGNDVAFDSPSRDLDPTDGDGLSDVFVKDLSTGVLTLASRTATAKGDGRSVDASLSADGARVAFSSAATDLVPGDTDPGLDTYVADLRTGEVALASATASGAPADALSINPSLAADGSRVAFATPATDLGPVDANGVADVYVRPLRPAAGPVAPSLDLSVDPELVVSDGPVAVTLTGSARGSDLREVTFRVVDEYGQVEPAVPCEQLGGPGVVAFSRTVELDGHVRPWDRDGRQYTLEATVTDGDGRTAETHLHVLALRRVSTR